MEETATIGIYVPSYKRSNAIMSEGLVEKCTYVVRQSEEEDYRKAGVKNIWAVPDEEVIGSLAAYRYIITHAPEDIVVTLDDDLKDLCYRTDKNRPLDRDPEMITAEIERIAQIMLDLNIGYGCTDASPRPFAYDSEFAFKGTSGGVRWVNKAVFKAKLDDKARYNWDLDLVLQELLVNRVIFKPKYLCDLGIADTNAGGDSDNKQRAEQVASIEYMKLKWGKYFRYNMNNNTPNIAVTR